MAWSYRGYDGERRQVAPIIQSLVRWLRAVDPGGSYLGALPSAEHRRRSPRSVHNTGRAVDWKPSSPAKGRELWKILTGWPGGADIQLVLYDGKQWGGRRGPTVTDIRSANKHTGHLHIESRSWSV